MPTLSIVIVSYNSRDPLDQCLKSVAQETHLDHEVIVVDNASADGTPSFLAERYPKVRLVANSTNLGFSAANNQGLKLASGNYRVLLNPDAVLLDRALDRMVEFLELHPQIGIIGPKLLNADGSRQKHNTWYPTVLTYLFDSVLLSLWGDQGSQEVDYICGACLMIRQETLNRIGLLDENIFMYAEDVDWCLRAKKSGWRIYHYTETRVCHPGGATSGKDVVARVFNARQGLMYFFRKHYRWISYFSLKGIILGESLVKMLFDGITYAWVGEDRRRIKRTRMRGFAELVLHLFHPPTFIKPVR